VLSRTALLEVAHVFRCRRRGVTALFLRAAACIEALAFCVLGNLPTWRAICLPSSNGFMTADALARIYAALANDGALAPQSRSR
jgi:hypothetical protein